MDMDSMGTNMFQTVNTHLARVYWYIVAAVVGAVVVVRAVNWYDARTRLHACASTARAFPTQPRTPFLQAWATLTAVAREASYPQAFVAVPRLSWLTPPPLGRVLVLLVYWAVIIGFMCAGAVIHDVNFYERIGFRNAWVTITQLPLLYLLAGKTSVLYTLLGVSHERVNWLHRWVARTMFVTASVHGWHFYTQYAKADLASYFFEVMPMGTYGMAAWGLLLWSFLVGLAPLRHLCYEVFLIQHIATAVLLLWTVHKHVPKYAEYNVWFAVAAFGLDRVVRFALLVWHNVRVARPRGGRCQGARRLGHETFLEAVGDDTVVVTIKDVHMRWRPGQHLYLWMPWLGPLEQHPYTIACAHPLPADPSVCVCNSVQLVVRKHGGFSRRLYDAAKRGGRGQAWTSCITGPFGEPARWDIYETLVLVAASTGASFTLPILEGVLQAAAAHRAGDAGRRSTTCTKRIEFVLAARTDDGLQYYVDRLHGLMALADDVGIELRVTVAVTGGSPRGRPPPEHPAEHPAGNENEKPGSRNSANGASSAASSSIDNGAPEGQLLRGACCLADAESAQVQRGRLQAIEWQSTRPDIAAVVRAAVETTGGETSVVVCGGKSLVAQTRNCVARLSDERAVHKGTGAQGIHLHVEEYGF